MKMKHISMIAAVFFVLTGCAKDQNTSSVDPAMDASAKAGIMGDMYPGGPGPAGLFGVLDLTDDQKEKIGDILASCRPGKKDGQGKHRGDKKGCDGDHANCPENRRHGDGRPGMGNGHRPGMMGKLPDEVHTQIMAVLTPEQQAKLTALKAKLDAGEMPEELVDARIDHMSAVLDLSDSQKTELKALFLKSGNAMLALKAEEGKKRGQFRKQMEETETAMLAILTEAQQEKWQDMRHARRQRAGKALKKMRGKHQAIRLERLTEELNLTADQQKAVKKILQDSRKDIKDLFKDADGRDEARQAMHDHQQEVNKEIMALLTPEQQETFKEHIAEHRKMRDKK